MDQRKVKTVLAIMIFMLTLAACSSSTPTAEANLPVTVIVEPTSSTPQNGVPLSEAEVPRVPLEEARVALESGAAIILDVRSPQAYEESHIAGAISIPLGEIETNPAGLDLDKDQWIITY